MTNFVRVETELPSGKHAIAVVRKDNITVAIDGRVAAAHRIWMTPKQVSELANDLLSMLQVARETP